MPASLLVCLPLLFAAAQPPGDGAIPPIDGQDPPQPNTSEIDPFADPGDPAEPAPAPQADPFGEPDPQADPFGEPAPPADPAEGSVGAPMREEVEETIEEIAEEAAPDANVVQPPANPLLDDPADPLFPVKPDPAPEMDVDVDLDVDVEVEREDDAEIEVPLDPADPDVVVVEEPAVTVITQPEPNPLAELIRNPYDIYDLREHAAIPADCLLARQACLPCTQTVTSCAPCCGGTTTETLPVPGVNPYAAEQIGQILLDRTPEDPRVSYLMFVLRYREGRYDEAFEYLEEAVRLEIADPSAFPNYGEFMTPIQGRSRVYLERVRRLAGVGVI